MVLDLDLQHETQMLLGLYERETFRFIRKAAQNCVWMVDVGAGNGELAIFFLRKPKCLLVHAFEPLNDALSRFRKNLELNQLSEDKRLVIHENFAGTTDGPAYTTLDSLDLDLGMPGFVKIDVDGFELDVLSSATRVLMIGQPDVLVEVHSEQLETDCISLMREFGYHVEIIENAWWRIAVPEERPIPHNRWIWCCKP